MNIKLPATVVGSSACLATYWSGITLLGGVFLSVALAATNLLGIPVGAGGLVIVAFGLYKVLLYVRWTMVALFEVILVAFGRLPR